MENREKKVGVLELCIPFIYIFAEYEIAGISLSWLLVLGMIFFLVIKYGIAHVIVFKPLAYLFVFMVIHDMLKSIYSTVNYGMWLERIMIFVLIIFMIGKVDEDKLFKVWSICSIVVLIGIIFHSYQIYILNIPATQIKILPFNFSDVDNANYAYFRPRSIFSEPAACVSWLAPLLAYWLRKGKLSFSIIITVSILLTTSSIGVVMVALLWIYTLFEKENSIKLNKKILLTLVIAVFAWLLFSTGIFSDTTNKVLKISVDNGSDYSRVLLGIMLYINAPALVRMWGIKYATVEDYLRSGDIALSKYHLSNEYSFLGFVNAFGNCILNYGFVGLILYVYFYCETFKVINRSQKGYFFICLVSIMSQSAFFNSYFLMQMSILLGTATCFYDRRGKNRRK